jgi:hypothetical protein
MVFSLVEKKNEARGKASRLSPEAHKGGSARIKKIRRIR